MKIPTVASIVKHTIARFVCYRDGELWYEVLEKGEGGMFKIFEFPVPISDTGNGIFPAELKTITLMRWVRKYIDKLALAESQAG